MFGTKETSDVRIVFALDRSGSMEGVVLHQALLALRACLGALSANDEFGIVAFDNRVDTTGAALLRGDAAGRAAAEKLIGGIFARGGTELEDGVREAAKMLGGGGDILMITDGQVSETETIIKHVRQLGQRVHVLSIVAPAKIASSTSWRVRPMATAAL